MTWISRLSLVVMVAAMAGCGGARSGSSAQPGQIPYQTTASTAPLPTAANLAPLSRALQALRNGQQQHVRIIQIGDSHTAGDRFTGRLRALFQGAYGSAGPGAMVAGLPYATFEPDLVNLAQTEGWSIANSRHSDAAGPYSLSGARVFSSDSQDTMILQSTEAQGFDHIEIGAFMHASGGSIGIWVDNQKVGTWSTRGNGINHETFQLDVRQGSRQLVLRPEGDGEVWLTSWSVSRKAPGVIFESYGIVGATIEIFNRWDLSAYTAELRAKDPDLVIVAFGTNEGFDDSLSPDAYAAAFANQLRTIQASAPGAAIVVVGSPDAARLPSSCRRDDIESIEFACRPLSADEALYYRELFRGDNVQPEQCRWHQPPSLAMVRQVQRQVATQMGYYFWDWSTAMGGPCSVHEWAVMDPPLARTDHVHLTRAGYERSAEMLYRALTSGGGTQSYQNPTSAQTVTPAPTQPAVAPQSVQPAPGAASSVPANAPSNPGGIGGTPDFEWIAPP